MLYGITEQQLHSSTYMNSITTKHEDVNWKETFGPQVGEGRAAAAWQGCLSASVHHKRTQEDWPPHLHSLKLGSLTNSPGHHVLDNPTLSPLLQTLEVKELDNSLGRHMLDNTALTVRLLPSSTATSEGAGLTDTYKSRTLHVGQPNTLTNQTESAPFVWSLPASQSQKFRPFPGATDWSKLTDKCWLSV